MENSHKACIKHNKVNIQKDYGHVATFCTTKYVFRKMKVHSNTCGEKVQSHHAHTRRRYLK